MAAGYKPIFYMPIIAPPTTAGASATYYPGLNVVVGATQTQIRQGIEITVSDPTLATVYAVCGGEISFFPAGATLPSPDNQVAPAGGVLVLRAWAVDFQAAKPVSPPGDEPAAYFFYFNLNDNDIASTVDALVPSAVKQPVLEKYWTESQSSPVSTDLGQLQLNYTTGVMNGGKAWLFVDGGTALGKALPDGSGVKFQLERLSAGNPQAYLSPAGTIRGVPDADKTPPLDRWTGHPLLAQVAAFPMPVEFHLKFTVWNPVFTPLVNPYSPLVNAAVKVVQTFQNVDTVIATGTTDASGLVNMTYADLSQIPSGQRMLHFEIDLQTNQLHYDRNTQTLTNFPMTFWSTKRWQSVDGLWMGSYDEFNGSNVGTAAAPAEFRIGLDFHVHFRRVDSISGTEVPFQKFSYVTVYTRSDKSDAQDFMTDETGAVEGVVYNVQDPIGDELYVCIEYATIRILEPGSIVARRAYFIFDQTVKKVDSVKEFTILGLPCATKNGQSIFQDFIVEDSAKSDAIYALQCVEEMCAFVTYLSPNVDLNWSYDPPYSGLAFFYIDTGISAYYPDLDSQGVKHEKIELLRKNWTGFELAEQTGARGDIIFHELTHAVNMHLTWSLQDNAAATFVPAHAWNLVTNIRDAFLEGFAEFFSGLFTSIELGLGVGNTETLSSLLTLHFTTNPPYGLAKDNKGRAIEGAFAFALYLIVKGQVVNGNPVNPVLTRTTGDFDLLAVNPWLKDPAVLDNFRNMIWEPLMSLAPTGVLDTTDNFVSGVKNNNPIDWPKLKYWFNQLHIAVEEPMLASLTFGQAVGGIPLKNTAYQGVIGSGIPGLPPPGATAGYVDKMTVSFVSGSHTFAATNVAVQSDIAFTMDVPALPPGVYDVVITTKWDAKPFPAFLTIAI